MSTFLANLKTRTALTAAALCLTAGVGTADIVNLDDTLIDGSLCIGVDCVNGENFGFDTIRMKENNVRLQFLDTSASASFPSNDWRIVANDSGNGGGNYLGIEDSTGGRMPFRVDAGAPADSLRVTNSGRVGFGTANPVVKLHVADGNSPSLRLEQNGSSGFTAQSWDVAGNETNFFIRDATNGSSLPFKIRPSAPNNAIFVDSTGKIGFGIANPAEDLHILSSGGANRVALELDSAANTNDMRIVWNGTQLRFSGQDEPAIAMTLTPTGDLTINGSLITAGGGGACTEIDPCDAVFDPEAYTVPSIDDHAAEMWTKKHLPAVGPVGPDAPINMTVKMLRMLNELEHAHIYIEQLHHRIGALEEKATYTE